jgi:DNA polymerase family A
MASQSENLPAVPDDGFNDTSSSDRLVQGVILRCVDGRWSTNEGTTLTPDMQFIALGTAEALQMWRNNKPAETIRKRPGVPLPDLEDLNAKIPKSEWELGLDRKPRAPWVRQCIVYLLDPGDASIFTYINSTFGALRAVSALKDKVKWMRALRGARVVPIVKLESKSMPTAFGTKQRPEFTIVEWRDLGDGAGESNLPPPTAPTTPAIEHKPAPVEHCAKEEAPPWDEKMAKPVEPTEIEPPKPAHNSKAVTKIGKPGKMKPVGKPDQPIPAEFTEAARDPTWIVAAWNDQFETALETFLLRPRFNWPLVPIERHRCTMVAALAYALPAGLDKAAAALGLPLRKDDDGRRLMMQMVKPRRPRKGEDPDGIHWHDSPAQLARLAQYCRRDVEVERQLHLQLTPLSDGEQALWVLDAAINKRGFHVDHALAVAAREIVAKEQEHINIAIGELTGGAITSPNQVARIQSYLAKRGHELKTLSKSSVAAALANGPTDEVKQLLELRRDGGRSSARKLDTLLAGLDGDNRLRGTFRYFGAGTGRWAGARFQPQNLKNPETENLDAVIGAILSHDLARVRELGAPLALVGDVSRSMICAAPGMVLIGADFSAIESRVLAWLAGERWKVDAYAEYDRTGDPALEPYCVTASKILKRTVTPESKADRKIGKTCDLAFGYGGGLGAYRRFDASDRYTDGEVETFKREWRAAHAAIVRLWFNLENGLRRATHTGQRRACG